VYNEELAENIMKHLNEVFPGNVRNMPALKEALSDVQVSEKDLLLAVHALKKLAYIKGQFSELGAHKVLHSAANLEITPLGREYLQNKSYRPVRLSLSNLPSKDRFVEDISALLAAEVAFAVIFFDLDKFKALNDSKGHLEGDSCLKSIVEATGKILGRRGTLYRWARGDEFMITLFDVNTDEALVTAERIRAEIEQIGEKASTGVTGSVGVCATDKAVGKSAVDFLDIVDKAMYDSKNSGGNRVRERHNLGEEPLS
jgi:diguanylate cyclase (GGDEF)-like protein